jgi:hypothetical protein
MPGRIFSPVISDLPAPAIEHKGNGMAESQYQFKKHQKELAKKKKKEEKIKRKLENKAVNPDTTEKEPASLTEDR